MFTMVHWPVARGAGSIVNEDAIEASWAVLCFLCHPPKSLPALVCHAVAARLFPRAGAFCVLLASCAQVSSDLAEKVHDSYILKEVTGSDHCPLGIVIKKEQ